MSQKVQFSDFIQPVCLPESNSNSANLYGTVVGYGKSETDKIHEVTPRQAQMYSISFSEYLLKAPIYSYIVSSRSICVGGTNSIPCLGDSGGGFFVKNSKSGQYEIKGIVSQAKRTNGCDPKDFVAFVDVAKFIDWIQIQMKDGINAKIKTTKVKEKVNLCESPSCGPNSKCSAPFGSIICTCLDDAIGNPPNCEKPECFDDFDCDENRACFKNKCKNLCEIKACKENEKCEMKNHKRECFSKNCLIGNLLVNNQCMENLNLVTGTISSSRCCEWLSGDIPIDRNLQTFEVNIGTKIQTETAVINPKYQSEEIEEFAIFNYLCGDKLCDLKSNIKNLPIQVNKIFPNLVAYFAINFEIKHLKKENFEYMKKLQFLRIYGNLIDTIDENAFDDLIELKYLDLYDNKISYLRVKTFENNLKLERIILYKNQISSITPENFNHLTKLTYLSLCENKLTQKCSILYLI